MSKMDRLLWFALAMDPEVEAITDQNEVYELLDIFLDRHKERLESEVQARRSGRPKSKVQEQIEQEMALERQEYDDTGFCELRGTLKTRHLTHTSSFSDARFDVCASSERPEALEWHS